MGGHWVVHGRVCRGKREGVREGSTVVHGGHRVPYTVPYTVPNSESYLAFRTHFLHCGNGGLLGSTIWGRGRGKRERVREGCTAVQDTHSNDIVFFFYTFKKGIAKWRTP